MKRKRMDMLRENLFSHYPEICLERAKIFTDSFKKTEGEPIILRRAKAFAEVLEKMCIYIQDGELIVGNLARKPQAAPIFPEFSVEWIEDELNDFSRRPHKRFLIEEKDKEELRKICSYWRGKTHFDYVSSLISSTLSHVVGKPGERGYQHPNIDEVLFLDYIQQGDGHIIPDYENILKKGMEGIIGETQTKLSELSMEDPSYGHKFMFLKSVIICCRAAINFASRYATKASEMAQNQDNSLRKMELEDIAKVCRNIPAHPVRSLHEAIQLVWFIHLLIHIESNGHSISLGRFDQYLYPFYKKDKEKGKIDPDRALELVECFLIKCCELNKLYDWPTTQITSNQLFQTLTLGGKGADGRDATNEFTYICLKATGNVKLFMPSVVVRIHNSTPDKFLLECCRALLKHGGGMPAFFNDEIAIPILLSQRVTLEDARNWASMGCCEIRVPGKYCSSSTPCYVNLLKPLEILLREREFTSYNELWSAYEEKLEYYLNFLSVIESIIGKSYALLTPTPFSSSTIVYRIDLARDISEGGGPNYNSTIIHGHGIPNVGDSLAAIKKLVFEEKRLSFSQLRQTLQNNFAGPKAERIRQLLKKAPKFGNDDDYVDCLTADVFRLFAKKVQKCGASRGGQLAPTSQTITMNVLEGEVVGATPDGRKAGETIADNTSPAPGVDIAGPTAIYKSVSKLDHVLMPNGTILNLKFHPTTVEDEERLWKFAQTIRTFFLLGGFQVQFNIVSADTLRDARKHPERYKNLIVKVAGYSVLFSELEKEWQDQLIARTEHTQI